MLSCGYIHHDSQMHSIVSTSKYILHRWYLYAALSSALRAIEVREEGRLFDDPLAAALAGPDALREADVYAKVQYSASYFAIILTGELNSLNSNDRLSAQLTAPDKLREANVSATVCSHQVPLIPGKASCPGNMRSTRWLRAKLAGPDSASKLASRQGAEPL